MQLSVIIVNYNVQSFLEQCLISVLEAGKNIDMEIWVVDNNSVDNSLDMLSDKFPQVKVIANKENVGFAKANNQAMRIASGQYILLLNPDTVVSADTFEKCIAFMDQTPDCGGLGVKMVDGKGRFLPESKRGLPTPKVAFYKIFGLSALFPKSKKFGQYHLSFLPEDQIHEVDVLAGAFMMMRKTVLDKVGLLDETFFMYGEDIDLSYRITSGGYKNYYFPNTKIIHYKGESTKKSSVNYVLVFYKAMSIFAKKHFSKNHAQWFDFLIHLAIYFRACLSLVKRLAKQIFLPLSDGWLMFFSMLLLKQWWATYAFQNPNHFPKTYTFLALPIYVLIWLACLYFSKAYKSPVRLKRVWQGIIIGTGIILIGYALSPTSWHFSRTLILLGGATNLIVLTAWRYLLHLTKVKDFQLYNKSQKHIAILGSESEIKRISGFLAGKTEKSIIPLHLNQYTNNQGEINIKKITESIRLNNIHQLIFCSKDLSIQSIITAMSALHIDDLDFKIAPENSSFLIGSQDVEMLVD